MVGAATTVIVRTMVVVVVQPLGLLFGHFWVVQTLGSLLPFKHRRLNGEWVVEWFVESDTFEPLNEYRGTAHKFLHFVALEAAGQTKSGSTISYCLLGRIGADARVVTGTWFDRNARHDGYYGAFQVVLHPTLEAATGKWIGFSKSNEVKAGEIRWTKSKPRKSF